MAEKIPANTQAVGHVHAIYGQYRIMDEPEHGPVPIVIISLPRAIVNIFIRTLKPSVSFSKIKKMFHMAPTNFLLINYPETLAMYP